MPSFRYLARDQFGVLQSGFLESDGREAAVAQLDHEGYFPIEIEEERRTVMSRLATCRRYARNETSRTKTS